LQPGQETGQGRVAHRQLVDRLLGVGAVGGGPAHLDDHQVVGQLPQFLPLGGAAPHNDETAARQFDCRPRPQGEDAVPAQLVGPVPTASDPPGAASAVHGTQVALDRSATAFQGVPSRDHRDERQQGEGEQREERPFGDPEPRSDVQLLPQESPAYPGRAPAYPPSPTCRDDGQAASPAARRRLRARATRACASSSPSAEPSARFSAVRARSTSISSASSAISARIEIRSPRVAAMKPPCTAARTSPVSRAPRMRTTEPGASSASTGTCPGWIPISPSTVLAMTMSPSPAQSSRSGVTSSTKSFFD